MAKNLFHKMIWITTRVEWLKPALRDSVFAAYVVGTLILTWRECAPDEEEKAAHLRALPRPLTKKKN